MSRRLVVETATRCCGRGVWSGHPLDPRECCGEPEVDVAHPTVADLVAYLQARPDLAVEVVGRLRVAGPWGGESSEVRYALRSGRIVAQVFLDCKGAPHGWAAGVDLGKHDSSTAARDAADAALTAAGWALAGGGR